mmetsp:Transcript_10367/g.31707  ORF Transcript_10367/g.31707 Transcript_10367/m.31707 type:complete len:213 (+) Transcript_10367:303-941(+)
MEGTEHANAERKMVAVDIDEVLGGFVDALSMFHNTQYGGDLSRTDFFSYTFREVWGGTEEESKAKVHAFFESDFFRNISPVEGSQAGIRKLQEHGFELSVVTSRQLAIEKQTRNWLKEHFPGAFTHIVFGNAWAEGGRKRSKPELCREVGASVLIDDSPVYTQQCAEVGIRGILFDLGGTYTWNKGDEDLHGLVQRVYSWDEAVERICATFA